MNGRWIDQFPPIREYDLELDEDIYELKMADAAAAQAAADRAEESARQAEEIADALREEIPTKVSELDNDVGYLNQETDPTVPAWAKQAQKPSYTPQEVGALPANTYIPNKTSDLTNDSNYPVDANYVHTDNNFTTSEKNKLEGIAAGAEVNVNADWNAVSGDAAILNKPTKVSDFQNDTGFITSAALPTKVSDLTDDSGHYTKPANGIPASDLEETYLTEHQDISGKADKNEIPTAVSQLDNDAGYITGYTETDPTVPAWAKASTKPSYTASEVGAPTVQEMNTAINNAIGSVNSFDVAVVQTLPSENINTHTIYLVPKTGETNDVYDEYIYINNAWEMVGNTQIDLSDYALKSEIPDVSVDDVQIDGTSIVSNGVANIPYASQANGGVVKIIENGSGGFQIQSGYLLIKPSELYSVKAGSNSTLTPIVPGLQDAAAFYGLAKAAGADEKNSSLAVGQYTENAKSAIQNMLGVTDSINNATSMLATVETTTTASKAYAVGDLLVYDGQLYKVISAITLGSTLIPNGNIEQTTIEQELNVANNDVTDVQVNGTSIVNNGVANVPIASASRIGTVQVGGQGLSVDANGLMSIVAASDAYIKTAYGSYQPITPIRQHKSTFYGLAKAAGDTTQAQSSNAVGTYTENAKSAIHDMLNGSVTVSGTTPTIAAKSGISYKCGEVSTLTITLPASGIVDVTFESGSTPTVLTVTPPTGVTLKWANGFDPTALEADTTYEINIYDGLGVAVTWT